MKPSRSFCSRSMIGRVAAVFSCRSAHRINSIITGNKSNPFSVGRYRMTLASVSDRVPEMIFSSRSSFSRSDRMFVAIPSPLSWISLNVEWRFRIRSRRIRNVQRSPRISRAMFSGHNDRHSESDRVISSSYRKDGSVITCETQVNRVSSGNVFHGDLACTAVICFQSI